eukprot:8463238-Pyramimonas_sp.AAC.1
MPTAPTIDGQPVRADQPTNAEPPNRADQPSESRLFGMSPSRMETPGSRDSRAALLAGPWRWRLRDNSTREPPAGSYVCHGGNL